MKYLGKIGAVIIAVLMATAIAVGIGVIYAVRNVNVTLLSYDGTDYENRTEIAAVKNSVLEKCRGKVISSVSEDEVVACIDDGYVLESFIKVYPCTVNIIVRQRRETFAVYNGTEYTTYDENGKFMRTTGENSNDRDGAPNLILEGTENGAEIEELAQICSMYRSRENFNSLRASVERIEIVKSKSSIVTDSDRLKIYMWCGLMLEIQDYKQHTEEKISKAYKCFAALSGEQKLTGTIYAIFLESSGEVEARYLPRR